MGSFTQSCAVLFPNTVIQGKLPIYKRIIMGLKYSFKPLFSNLFWDTVNHLHYKKPQMNYFLAKYNKNAKISN